MEWLHPAIGLLAVLLVVWVGMAGLRSRQRDPLAPAARRQHARFAPLAGLLVLLAALSGSGSVGLLRPDLALAQSPHFGAGLLVLLLAGLAALSSRQPDRRRRWHPVIGLLLLLACVGQALLGLSLLP